MAERAFICYSSKDSAVANKIVSGLESAGIPCWIAPRNIPSGSRYAASIVQGIKGSALFVFVFTKSSNNSDAVINEIEKANALKIPIIPFKVDNEEYSDSLEYYLRSKQSISAYDKPMDTAINDLIESIGGQPVPRRKPLRKINYARWLLIIAVPLLLLIIFLIYSTRKTYPNPVHLTDTIVRVQHDTEKIKDSAKKTIKDTKDKNNKVYPQFANKKPDDIPSITGVGSKGFFFVRKTAEGDVEYSSGQLGGTGSDWQAINRLDGSAPAAASIGNSIYLVAKDINNAVLLCQGSFNGAFGPWISMNFSTDSKPAIAAAGPAFYYFARNSAHQIFYNYANLNAGGVGWKQVDGSVTAASGPTAGSVGNHVFVAVRGTNNKIYYNQADAGGPFNPNWDVMDFETQVAPTIVGAENYVYIFAVKINGEIWFTRAALSQKFEQWKVVNGNGHTNFPVTAGTAGSADYIFIEMKGIDGKIYLNQGFTRFQENWAVVK